MMDSIPSAPPNESNEESQAKQAQEEQVRRDLLATVLENAARERRT